MSEIKHYTPITHELFDIILADISTSEDSNSVICAKYDVSYRALSRYIVDPEFPERKTQYIEAKEMQADIMGAKTIEIADESVPRIDGAYDSGMVQNKRVRIEARKWYAGKLSSRYSDKIEVQQKGTITVVSAIPRPDPVGGAE